MFNLMISIPVHEKTEVIIDQIFNINFFCPNCGIVLHISKRFDWQNSFHTEREFQFLLSQFENVFVNPNQMDTVYGDILHAHILNFEYISQVADFEYFSMDSSNDLFVRQMSDLKTYDACCGNGISPNWIWNKQVRNDGYFKAILDDFGASFSDVRISQIEGSYYRKNLFQEIVTAIKKHYGYNEVFDQNKTVYPREEVYFSTVARLLNKNGILHFTDNNYTFMAWNNPEYLPTPQEIADVTNGKVDGKFSIKRVLRTIDNDVRVAVGTQIGNYRAQAMDFIKNKMRRTYLQLFNLVAGRKRIFICYTENKEDIENIFSLKDGEEVLIFNSANEDVEKIVQTMQENKNALFLIFLNIYPAFSKFLTKIGFRENVDFINGTLLLP